jgi:hypothetical protein
MSAGLHMFACLECARSRTSWVARDRWVHNPKGQRSKNADSAAAGSAPQNGELAKIAEHQHDGIEVCGERGVQFSEFVLDLGAGQDVMYATDYFPLNVLHFLAFARLEIRKEHRIVDRWPYMVRQAVPVCPRNVGFGRGSGSVKRTHDGVEVRLRECAAGPLGFQTYQDWRSRAHGYPPDKQEQATLTVLAQAELLCRDWVA